MGRLIRGLFAFTAVLFAAAGQAFAASSLPSVSTGHRPGPDALYLPAPKAPQLESKAPWKADPILVSGTQAYRNGEYLYQDYLYDDHGAIGVPDLNSPYSDNADLFSPPAGTFTYPTDLQTYAGNSADLVEFRVKPLDNATAFRVTLNSLPDPARTGFTIAIGDSGGNVSWPHGAGVSSPARYFLTEHGGSAELLNAATGQAVTPAPTVSIDTVARQIDVRVAHSAWDPATSKVRMTIGTGLWDPDAGSYLAPQPGSASETTPGGGPGAAIVNVGPRFDEPWPNFEMTPTTYGLADSAVGAQVQSAWWREHNQATALTTGDLSSYHADVDFAKLAERANDDSGVPTTGPMDRILASRYHSGQGYNPNNVCFDLGKSFSAGAGCIGRMVGQLQPYAIYIPKKPQPADGYGLTLLLHSLSANYNQYSTSRNQSELGDRGDGSIVITPADRGPDGFYAGIAEADTFEVWADVARRYRLDPSWSAVSGYSMGGFGTYRLLARWPDLFARGFSVVGAPGSVDDQLASLRNTPLLLWNALADELVNIQTSENALKADEAAGLRVTEWLFPTADHLALATNDEYTPGAEWLGDSTVNLNPPHVTLVVDPTEDSNVADSVSDHAYWVSDVGIRDKQASGDTGTFDARSEAFGVGDPQPTAEMSSAGALQGGQHGPMPYYERKQDWAPTPQTPAADRLDVNATNVAHATVDATRARLSCAPDLVINTDGPLDLTFTCSKSGGAKLRLPRVSGQQVVSATAISGGQRLATARGDDLRTLSLARAPRASVIRLVLRTNGAGGNSYRITVLRRVATG